MKIADFFISLGFNVKGGEELPKTEQAMGKLEFSGLKLLAGVTAINAAFYAMMTKAVEASVVLQKFALTTGLSSEKLQDWQFAAAKGNVAAGQVVDAIKAIQSAQAAIAFGNAEGAAPWLLLGIDPRQDPFKVLTQLQAQIQKLDPAIARKKLSEMGFGDDIFYLMKQGRFGTGGLGKNMIVSNEERDNLAKLGAEWRTFLFTLGQVATRFSAQFAEPLAAILKELSVALGYMGKFVTWLEGGSVGATAFMYAMLGLLVVLGALAIALPLLMTGPVGLWIAGTIAAVGAVGYLVLRIQDLWVALRGGKSAFSITENIRALSDLLGPLSTLVWGLATAWDILAKNIAKAKEGLGWAKDILGAAGGVGGSGDLMGRIAMGQAAGSSSSNQTNHINVHAPGGSPTAYQYGQDVGRIVTRHISDAFAASPLFAP